MGSIGTLSFPPYVLHYALCFLDGRGLTVFETASKGTKEVVDHTPGLYKTLLVRRWRWHGLLLLDGVRSLPTFYAKSTARGHFGSKLVCWRQETGPTWG